MNKCTVVILIFNSILCATGILLILISCIQYQNWFPLLTIGVHGLAILFPVMCGGCNFSEAAMFDQGNEFGVSGLMLSWLLVGIFIIVGYAIPSILLRAGVIPEIGLILTFSGGTVILMSILIFVRLVYFKKSSSSSVAYIL